MAEEGIIDLKTFNDKILKVDPKDLPEVMDAIRSQILNNKDSGRPLRQFVPPLIESGGEYFGISQVGKFTERYQAWVDAGRPGGSDKEPNLHKRTSKGQLNSEVRRLNTRNYRSTQLKGPGIRQARRLDAITKLLKNNPNYLKKGSVHQKRFDKGMFKILGTGSEGYDISKRGSYRGWGIDEATGKARSVKGFYAKMAKAWRDARLPAAALEQLLGIGVDRGHGISAMGMDPTSIYPWGGSNWFDNVAPESKLLNIMHGKGNTNTARMLHFLGQEGGSVDQAFQAYLAGEDVNFNQWKRFSPKQLTAILHSPNAEQAIAQIDREALRKAVMPDATGVIPDNRAKWNPKQTLLAAFRQGQNYVSRIDPKKAFLKKQALEIALKGGKAVARPALEVTDLVYPGVEVVDEFKAGNVKEGFSTWGNQLKDRGTILGLSMVGMGLASKLPLVGKGLAFGSKAATPLGWPLLVGSLASTTDDVFFGGSGKRAIYEQRENLYEFGKAAHEGELLTNPEKRKEYITSPGAAFPLKGV